MGQKGRLQASNVINCEPTKNSIRQAIEIALSKDFTQKAKKTINPYGNGDTSDKVIEVLKEYLLNSKIDLKKKFYDLEVK